MRRGVKISLGILALVVVGAVAYAYFAPKPSTRVDEAAPSAATLKTGQFHDGLPGHTVTGTVSILRDATGALTLRFENYEATAGPDVFFYLTRTAGAESAETVEGNGIRLVVPGGAGDGQATLRGNFNVPLPEGLNPAEFAGVAVWCDRYNAYFGGADFA